MPTLDAFNTDTFNTTSLTAAINRIDVNPQQVTALGIFEDVGLKTKTFFVDMRDGVLTLLDARPRGGPAQADAADTEAAVQFECLHYPYVRSILADDLVGARQFGSEDANSDINAEITKQLAGIKANKYEKTWERLKMSALQGLLSYTLNGVAKTSSMFTAFGVSQQTQTMAYTTDTTDMEAICTQIRRKIENKLGGTPYTGGIHGLLGTTEFDGIKGHALVRDALKYTQPQPILDGGNRIFNFGGITFEEYTGGTDYIAADAGYFFPIGVPQMFQMGYAPSTMIEAIGTAGIPLYVSQEPMAHNKGIELYVESNPFAICTRPDAVVFGTDA